MMKMLSRKELIDISKEILAEYEGQITIRQLYYRFVAKQLISNNEREYKRLKAALVVARVKTQEIPFDAFEDKTRDFTGDNDRWFMNSEILFDYAKSVYESAEETFKNTSEDYNLPKWYGQPNYVEVWCEKDALENVFLPVCKEQEITFGTARGCASISWLYEAAERFRKLTKSENFNKIIVLAYTDNDPTGWQIFTSFENYLYDVFHLENVEVRRMALTKEQIEELNIPTDYAKSSDSRSKKWITIHGAKAVAELDAIEPRTLAMMVENHILELWDNKAAEKRESLIKEGREEIQQMIDEYGED